ncbi:MAG TPA: Wzz/FepE/Etk N-terminal domain-containing protein [Terriglobales bacterium]|nr:Wzz/FepE/Etk N-terminal domain-containing protein [Terriglobales bacterium]
MFGERSLTTEDYVRFLKRRWWIILIPALLGPVIGFSIAKVVPSRYRSRALVLVEQQQVSDRLVTPVISEGMMERLSRMQEQLLSRSRLQPIIERVNLYGPDTTRVPMETLVDRMRKDISFEPAPQSFGATSLPGILITFDASSAQLAKSVCEELTSMFLKETLLNREKQAQDTTDFLTQQLEQAKQKLDEQDRRLAEFKRRYLNQLPGSEQSNMGLLNTLSSQLDTATQAVVRAEQDREFTETLLSQQRAALQGSGDQVSPQTTDDQLQRAQAELSALEARYTPAHPDVVKKRREVETLRSKRDAAASNSAPAPAATTKRASVSSPEIQRLENRLYELQQTIRENKTRQSRLQEQISTYQSRVLGSPLVEEQLKQITRDYDTALAFYNDLLAKKTQAEMSTDLERRQQGEQFRLQDPPNLPEKPTFPNPLIFTGGGLGAGLALGIGMALLLELRSQPLYSEADVEFYLRVPVLGVVPQVMSGNTKKGFRSIRGGQGVEGKAAKVAKG